MRDIKFRGISIKTGALIFGSLLLINGKAYIYDKDYGDLDDIDFGWGFEEVLIETVGQSIGLSDKQDIEIYEGDIMKHPSFDEEDNLKISIENGCTFIAGWDCVRTSLSIGEVIGNIHENKELLEG